MTLDDGIKRRELDGMLLLWKAKLKILNRFQISHSS